MRFANHRIANLALPDGQHIPARSLQRFLCGIIPRAVSFDLLSPIVRIGLGLARTSLAVVPVPKTPVNEDDLTSRAEYEIRTTGKIASMKPIAVAQRVDKATDDHFRLGVLSFDGPHDPRPLRISRHRFHRPPAQPMLRPRAQHSGVLRAIADALPVSITPGANRLALSAPRSLAQVAR